jgi:uncharacterized protein (DUF111 family)
VVRAVIGARVRARTPTASVPRDEPRRPRPQHFEYLMERLFEARAPDVSLQPIQMKK